MFRLVQSTDIIILSSNVACFLYYNVAEFIFILC